MRAKRATHLLSDASPVAFREVICKLHSTFIRPAKYKPFRVQNLGIFRPNIPARLSSLCWPPTGLSMRHLFLILSKRVSDQNRCRHDQPMKFMRSCRLPRQGIGGFVRAHRSERSELRGIAGDDVLQRRSRPVL